MSRKANQNARNRNNTSNTVQDFQPVSSQKPNSLQELKKTEFQIAADSARSVLLAADFTDWEKSALEMQRVENGLWRVEVPLASGNYSYRFIVDGQWCDDPDCVSYIPNAFGTANATRTVA